MLLSPFGNLSHISILYYGILFVIKEFGCYGILIKYILDIQYVVLITRKKCGDINYLTSEALGNLTDFGLKCRYCITINRITLKDGEPKKQD
jgi:hypothetical protein